MCVIHYELDIHVLSLKTYYFALWFFYKSDLGFHASETMEKISWIPL